MGYAVTFINNNMHLVEAFFQDMFFNKDFLKITKKGEISAMKNHKYLP